MVGLFDYVNDISYSKKYLLDDEQTYNPFMTNRSFSFYSDTIFIANEANGLHNLDKKLQHDFLFYSINKRKRFAKWPKKINDENILLISNYYKYSIEKAKIALSLLSDEQLAIIKKENPQGGVEK